MQSSGSTKALSLSPSKVHQRLSSLESFPAVYRYKFDENAVTVSGDYIDDPRKAITLLKSTSNAELTIPQRAADFKTEVQWRLLLRNSNS